MRNRTVEKENNSINSGLAKLRGLRAQHGFRAATLVPDLAFIGLVDDTIDAVEEALSLLDGPRPHRAYAIARIAFEAAQRLIVLGTADDYLELGTRAWLYYVGKDEALVAGRARDAVAGRRDKIIETWSLRNGNASAIVAVELEKLRKKKGPDNFLGRDMAEAAGAAYAKLAKLMGSADDADMVQADRAIYRMLCRDAHACIRLEPRGISIDSDGFVEVLHHDSPKTHVQSDMELALGSALADAITAVTFRIAARDVAQLSALRKAVQSHEVTIREDFRRDFGIHLLEQNLAHASQVFTGVEIHNIAVLPDTTVAASTTVGVDDEVFMATFDFKGERADEILATVAAAYPELQVPRRVNGERTVCHLPVPHVISIVASVAYFHHNDVNKFVPLLVSKIF
jgi:hypothetical protein